VKTKALPQNIFYNALQAGSALFSFVSYCFKRTSTAAKHARKNHCRKKSTAANRRLQKWKKSGFLW
jgi:hypothetical protein